MKVKLKIVFLFAVFVNLLSCNTGVKTDEDCAKFSDERYPVESNDTTLVNGAVRYQEYLLDNFEETSVKDEEYEAYSMQYYSSHGFGKSIRFEKKFDAYYLNVNCYVKEGSRYEKCRKYDIYIDEEDWGVLEEMIYEFNFWTTEAIKPADPGILDGYVYLLEGNRPIARECGRKTYKLVVRGSPGYDKMAALCSYIMNHEEQLVFKHEKQIIRNSDIDGVLD